ncbi:hypothetical protein BJX66DRAFT_342097 [Aspergillus keveii]|uniref:Uncharacterized protein n=1 Tax=Aspergillus keveii TaxID=714993 RepID=A0ABR4FTE1_9EURO
MMGKISRMLKHTKSFEVDGPAVVRLTDPVTEFIDNRVVIKPHSSLTQSNVLGRPILRPESGHQLTLPDGGVELDSEEHNEASTRYVHLAEVILSFESTLPTKYKTQFDIKAKHSWDEVIQEAKSAEAKYNDKGIGDSASKRARRFFRALQKRSAAVEGWMEVFPTQNLYANIICGGFKVVLRAATRMNAVKDFIIEALATIPDEVERAQLMMDCHQNILPSERLYRSVSQLYSTVFKLLEHIVLWFSQRLGHKILKAVMQQGEYERHLEAIVKEFKTSVSNVKAEADVCSQHRLRDLDRKVDRHQMELRELLQRLHDLLTNGSKLRPHLGDFQQLQGVRYQGKAISRQSLCDAVLRYSEDVPPRDLATMLLYGRDLSLKEQDRAVHVIESKQLKKWLLAPQSSILLVNGNASNLDLPASATSFVAAYFAQSLQSVPKSRLSCLYWFTNQHRDLQHDADANVHGALRSLIGQLLHTRNTFDLHFIKRRTAKAIRDKNDLDVLCNLFEELIHQLQENTVTFCIVDALACLEYECRKDVLFLVHRLCNIVRQSSRDGGLFKLLITHAGGAFWAASEFQSGMENLLVPENPSGNRMGFNDLIWDAGVGCRIEELRDSGQGM